MSDSHLLIAMRSCNRKLLAFIEDEIVAADTPAEALFPKFKSSEPKQWAEGSWATTSSSSSPKRSRRSPKQPKHRILLG